MGLNFGGSAGGSSSTTNTNQNSAKTDNGTASQQFTYTDDQQSLQAQLMKSLQSLISGGGSTPPQVQAAQNASAGQINSEYASVGDRMNRFLASRGFQKSGQAGTAALKTELGRQNALAQNSATYGMKGLDLFSQGLSDAMAAAFKNTGTTASTFGTSNTNSTGNSNTDSSNWGVKAGVEL